MNTPKTQTDADHPPRERGVQPKQTEGVPDAAVDAEPTATPNADRQKSETVPAKT